MNPAQALLPYLNQARRRLRLRDGLLLAQNTLWQAGLVSLLVLLAGRVFPIPRLWLWAALPLAAWLAGWLGYALLRRLPPMHVARQVDAELRLKERLSTSLALEQTAGSPLHASFAPDLVEQTHADALLAARQIEPARDFPLRARRRPLLVAAGLLLAAAALVYLPNPMDAVLEEQRAVAEEAQRQAAAIEELHEEIENAPEMTAEEREDLLRRLAELAEQLRSNPGDREQALADLARLEEDLRQRLDPLGSQRQAALDAMAAQLQALAQRQDPQVGDLEAAAEAIQELAEQLEGMSEEERRALAEQLAQMAARAAQAGDSGLAQALAAMAQAAQAGDMQSAQQSAASAAQALQQAQGELADQRALSRSLSQLDQSRQRMSQAGQSGRRAQGQSDQPGQPGQQGQGQGQGQGQQPGGGGGANANQMPPGSSSGQPGSPRGEGAETGAGSLDSQVYAPRAAANAEGEEVFIPGQDTSQGETQTSEQPNPLGGVTNPSLISYDAVFQTYRDAANQAIDQSYIPPGLKDYIRDYFSQLEP